MAKILKGEIAREPAGTPVPNAQRGGVVEDDGVRTTADSNKNTNVQSITGERPTQWAAAVDARALVAQDANDGKEDGDQKSATMPPFANGRDLRPGRK